ncbi:polymorphic toxin-type HINT domain-containing protein [Pseudenhygromyxa sp. WMMC2535]|uniref:polymorphic toxin-type HINT domain-containing protein n=1 Tax=Pseudenhygromyxa sp. WMMC2535 TaxID=2712867 RepID=UPI0031F9B799
MGCFVPGTRVRTPEGAATPGDQVLAGVWIDGELRLVPRVIEAISVREISEIIDLRYLTETGERATLELTPDHPLFAPEYQAYLQVAALALGDQLLLEDGQLAVVEQIARREGEFEVFNLSVEDAHNYFAAPVGDGPAVLVHNGVCSDLAARLSANYRLGRAFEQAVLKQLGKVKNTTKVRGTALNGRAGNTIPDIMGAEVGEIKNRMVVSNTRQMQIQADVAEQLGVPFNVYISPEQRMSPSL